MPKSVVFAIAPRDFPNVFDIALRENRLLGHAPRVHPAACLSAKFQNVRGDSSVTSNAAMFMFYDRVASHRTGRAFETTAATNAGNEVRAEVQKYARTNSR